MRSLLSRLFIGLAVEWSEAELLFKPHLLKPAMSLELTPLLDRFVSHMNNHDSAAFTACFADDAVVEDEGQTYQGRAAIEAWISKAFAQAAPTLDLKEARRTASGSLLSGMVSGTFPGSPIMLHYHLAHDDAQISHLRCTV